jgi:hypothetical protein
MKTFRQDLEELINSHSMENGSNTPDFILAEYLASCLKTFDRTMKQRDSWYKKNNICAKATLYPGKSIAEVEDIQFMDRMEESYKFINSVLLGTEPMNVKQTRQWVQKVLEGRLKKYSVVVKCNEENNPVDVIKNCLLVARIMRPNPDRSSGYRFTDLIFGDEQKVRDYQIQHYFDSNLYSFIEKGI